MVAAGRAPTPGKGSVGGAMRKGERSLLDTRLKQNVVFSGLPEETRNRIASAATSRRFARGELIARELSSPDHLILLLDGSAQVCRCRNDGTPVVFRILYPPVVVGLLLLSGQPHTADIVAAGPVLAAQLPVRIVRSVFDANRQLLYKVITQLAELVDALSGELIEQRSLPLVERLRTAIWRNADQRGELRLSHEELAGLVGATRANVTRALKQLEVSGQIEVGRRVIRILAG